MSSSIAYIDPLVHQDYQHLFKCLLLGNSGCGKSSIVDRFVDPQHILRTNYITTIGVDFKVQSFLWEGKIVKLQIWDTAGQERFRSIVNSYYRGAHGILLVYDLTDPSTAISLRMWLQEIEKFAKDGIPIILVGNKVDLIHSTHNNLLQTAVQETRDVINELQNEFPLLLNYECSAKSGESIEEAFLSLIKAMIKDKQHSYHPYDRTSDQTIKPDIRKQSGNILTGSSLSSSSGSGSSSCCG